MHPLNGFHFGGVVVVEVEDLAAGFAGSGVGLIFFYDALEGGEDVSRRLRGRGRRGGSRRRRARRGGGRVLRVSTCGLFRWKPQVRADDAGSGEVGAFPATSPAEDAVKIAELLKKLGQRIQSADQEAVASSTAGARA